MPVSFHYHCLVVRIVDRYVLRELWIPFVLGIGVFTSVLLIVRILKLVEMVVNRGVPLLQILLVFSYILPAFLELTVPMALLLGILVAFGRLSSDSEIIALRASGISLYRLMLPVGAFAGGVAFLTLCLSLYVRPWGNSLLRTGLYDIVKARASAGIKPQVFNDEFNGLVIYVDRIVPPGNDLIGVLISDTRNPPMQNTIYARSGTVYNDQETHSLTLHLAEGGIFTSSARGDSYQDTRFDSYDITLDLKVALAEMRSRPKDPGEMTLAELQRSIVEKRSRGIPSFAEQVELHRKFSIPFACLVFAALGVPLGIQPSRAVHSRGFSVSICLIFVYYLLLTLGQNLAERGSVPPFLAMWLPNFSLSAVASTLFFRAARDINLAQPNRFDRWSSWLRSRLGQRAGQRR
jgi:lipopolysaccharide export system permease protein